MSEWLVSDNGTIALGVGLVAVLFLGNYLFPQSLVHPILLGRQSDVERVRRKGESAIYRNYSTGLMGRLPLRPAKEVEVLSHLIKPDYQGSRTLWSTKLKNSELNERVSALSTGFIRIAGLLPRESNVLLLLNDSIEFLITDLALSSQSIPSFTLSSLTLFSSILESHPPSAIILHSHFLGQVLELIMDNSEMRNHTLIVLGKKDLPKGLDKLNGQIRILDWEQLEADGSKDSKVDAVAVQADEVFSVAFFPGANGELRGSRLSHMNMTAAVASTRLILPLESAISDKDAIVSAHSLTTPHGRALAYTALYECTSFTTTKSTELFKTDDAATTDLKEEILQITKTGFPLPTVLFINPPYLHSLINPIIQLSKRSMMFSLGWRQKLFGIQQGFVSKSSLWDNLVFEPARKSVMGDLSKTLRGVIVSGGLLEENIMTPTRLILSVPFVNAYTSPVVAGPICASHGFDLQSFRISEEQTNGNEALFTNVGHVGPPTINVEVKLSGVDDDAVEEGANPMGEALVRGPTVALPVDVDDPLDGWVATGDIVMIQPNGTFKISGSI